MSHFRAFGQDNVSTLQIGFSALPAGATILRARLHVYTWFSSHEGSLTFQGAPPNTILGISNRAAGVAPELVDFTNWGDATWYVAGPGRLVAFDRWAYPDIASTPNTVDVQHVYATEIENDDQVYNAASMSQGISINFMGGGFWAGVVPYLSYTFDMYWD